MRFRKGWLLLVASALVAGACNTGETAEPDTASFSSSTWSRVSDDEALGGAGFQTMSSVTAGGPGLVAVGTDFSGDGAYAAVWTSSDGVTWSRVPHTEALGRATGQGMLSVTVGGPGLVAVGVAGPGADDDAAVWTSPDGITWSRVPHDEAVFGGAEVQAMLSVTVGGPGLVAVGGAESDPDGDAVVWTSPDGITWSRVPDDEALGGAGFQMMSSVTVGGPGLVAVGVAGPADGDAAVWTSPDGVTWSRVPDDEALGGAGFQEMRSVTVGGPGLVAVGGDGSRDGDAAVWTSPDGVTWSRVPHDQALGGAGDQTMLSVTAAGSGLVAVGWDGSDDDRDAAVWTSPDGITWSRVPDDEAIFGGAGFQTMLSVTMGGPGLVAVGVDFMPDDDSDAAVWLGATE